MVAKTGFVPPVNLRSESASIIWMELKYFLKDIQLFRYISYIPNNSYCGNAGVIWYFEPHGKLNPGSIYIHGILNPLIENWTPLYGKLNPRGIWNPPIYNKKICREVKISCVGGRYSMARGVKIPCIGESIYHG